MGSIRLRMRSSPRGGGSALSGPGFAGDPSRSCARGIHYALEENWGLVYARVISGAELSIDRAATVLSDRPVIEALTAAAERGVAGLAPATSTRSTRRSRHTVRPTTTRVRFVCFQGVAATFPGGCDCRAVNLEARRCSAGSLTRPARSATPRAGFTSFQRVAAAFPGGCNCRAFDQEA